MQKIQSAKHFDIAQNIELDSFVVKQMLIIDLLMKIGNYVVSVQVSTVCNYLSELETERWILSNMMLDVILNKIVFQFRVVQRFQ